MKTTQARPKRRARSIDPVGGTADSTNPLAPNQVLELWPHQRAAIAVAHSAIAQGRRSGLWSLPTGTGKTVAFANLARELDSPTLVLVHRDELVRQSVDEFARSWPDALVGVIKAQRDEWRNRERVVVASVQSLQNGRLSQMPRDRFGFVVADEAHHAIAPTWRAVIEHFQVGRQFLLGVTATPERLDGQGLDELFGPRPLYTYPLRQAITDGVLVRLRQFAIDTETSLDGIAVRADDFAVGELSRATNTPARNKVVVEAYRKHASDRRAVLFAVDIAHAKTLAGAFKTVGVAAAFIDGAMPLTERRDTLERFRAGAIRVLCNCEVLTEGWDDRGVNAVLMARPTKSRSLYTQCVGRALRRCDEENKRDALILDFTDNAKQHKLVTALDLLGATHAQDAKGGDVLEVIDADRAEAERRKEIASQRPLKWRLKRVCPWPELPTLAGYVATAWWHDHQASEKQVAFVRSFGVDLSRALTKGEAGYLIDRVLELRAANPEPPRPASPNQRYFLRHRRRWRNGMSFAEAQRAIGQIKGQKRRWGR